VLAGKGTVTIDDEDRAVSTGSTAYIPGDNEHGIRNTGNGRSRFFYAFAVLPPSLPRWGTPVAAR
jgi:quercetin dioxygenase-like cupin family protein